MALIGEVRTALDEILIRFSHLIERAPMLFERGVSELCNSVTANTYCPGTTARTGPP